MKPRLPLAVFGPFVGLFVFPGAAAAGPEGKPDAGSAVAGPTVAPNMNVVKETVKDMVKAAIPGAGVAPAVPTVVPAQAPPVAIPGVVPVAGADPADRLAALRHKTLKDDDFVDNDETNRDPFRSFIRLFVEKAPAHTRQVPAIFEKWALEDLALIAVVSGDATPRSMFRNPEGLGHTIKRGDYLSKSGARVTKILSDRVILELTEITPSGETRTSEKAVLVNPEGAQK